MSPKEAKNKSASEMKGRDPALLIEMLRRMLLIRAFESQLPGLSTQSLIRGSSHACIGQEATAVGACFALQPTDYVTSTHRGHGHTIAKGGDVKFMMAELLGRKDGCCHGKGGSMHIADFSIGMLGANGIVGGGIGIATGAALSASIRKSGQVTLCFFGEGAINQGILLECGNMAALWKLPLVFLCENNQFSMSTRPDTATSTREISQRMAGIGIPGTSVNGMDVLAVFDEVSKAAERARTNQGPSFVECVCYRFEGHFLGDGLKYRDKDEFDSWKLKDPVAHWQRQLIGAGILDDASAQKIVRETENEVSRAVEFAKASPFPEPADTWEDLYA